MKTVSGCFTILLIYDIYPLEQKVVKLILGASSVTKGREKKRKLFFVTCQILWASLTVFAFFPVFSLLVWDD